MLGSTAAKTEKTGHSSLADDAYERLKHEVLSNRMPPGFQALEPEISNRLNMSRTPVREALIRLQEEGLIEMIPRRGMRVLPLSPDDMREIYEVLVCVEAEAVALLAARKPSREDLFPLEEAVCEMESALERDDLDAWANADSRFHILLGELCGNGRLASIAETLHNQVHRARMLTLRLREKPVRSTNDHRKQISRILEGNPEAAREAYREHRERVTRDLLEILRIFRLHNL